LAQNRIAAAMMDLSDGLSMDLPRLCASSGVGAQVEIDCLPIAKIAAKDRKKFPPTELALHGGDDYELLLTVAKRNIARVPAAISGLPLTRIGTITSEKRVELIGPNGRVRSLAKKGWDPFR
jgi:thiamine-monophosphate kinase